MKTKENIRKHYLLQRNTLSASAQMHASARICEKILALPLYLAAQHIALYHAVGHEVSLQALMLTALEQQKQVYLPIIQPNGTLHFAAFQKEDPLILNVYHIPEPAQRTAISIQTLDLLLVPLVAFDKTGARLGHGKGYYDQALQYEKPKKIIGVAYACQYYPEDLPQEAWDIPLDGVVTEEKVEWF